MSEKVKRKNQKRTILTDEERCNGLKTDGERCTRKHLPDSKFCKSHSRKPDNTIKPVNDTREVKKRGRKPKIIPDDKLKDPETYLPVIYTVINGEKLLIDFRNRVYTNDLENPRYLGVKTVDGLVKE